MPKDSKGTGTCLKIKMLHGMMSRIRGGVAAPTVGGPPPGRIVAIRNEGVVPAVMPWIPTFVIVFNFKTGSN